MTPAWDYGSRFERALGMARDKSGSRQQYKRFIKDNGVFSFRKPPEVGPDGEEVSGKPKKSVFVLMRRYFSEIGGQRQALTLIVAMNLLLQGLGATFPWFSKLMIDTIIPQKSYGLLAACCALLLVFALCQVLLDSLNNYMLEILRGNILLETKRRLMRHLQTLPLHFLQKLKTGGVISRLQSDTDATARLVDYAVINPLRAGAMFMIALVSLVLLNWQVTVVCLGFCGVIGVLTFFIFNIMRPFQKLLRKDVAEINAHLTEVFTGIQVVRGFQRERTVQNEYSGGTNLLRRKSIYSFMVGMLTHRCIWLTHYSLEVSIWLFGGYYVFTGKMSVGSLVVFISFIRWLFIPIFDIMGSFSSFQESLACAERSFDLLDEKADILDRPGSVEVRGIKQGITLKDVSFSYPDGTKALVHVDLFIPDGKVTALVGPSGSGKTTITNVVTRFYDVTEGAVLVDGLDIRQATLASYRSLISLVLQDVFLFDGTVRDNITFGKHNATEAEVLAAARTAHCHEFIEALEKKYDTVIGERGVKLSGGQKQRLALARAVLTAPRLLILDEATSNLDSESEGLIQEALREIFKSRGTLVIAHRLSTIMDADNIVVIEKGAVVEQGRHQELLERRGRYFEMYSKQMEKARLERNYWSSAEQ